MTIQKLSRLLQSAMSFLILCICLGSSQSLKASFLSEDVDYSNLNNFNSFYEYYFPTCPTGNTDTDYDGICDYIDADDDNDGILDVDEKCNTSNWGTSPWTWTEDATNGTINISPSLSMTIDISTSAVGVLETFVDEATGGLFGGVGDLAILFDPIAGQGTSAITILVTFSEPIYNGKFLITDVDGGFSNPGRQDKVTVTSNIGTPTLSTITSGTPTYILSGNIAENVNPLIQSVNDDLGSVLVDIPNGATTITILYEEVGGLSNPNQRGIGVEALGSFCADTDGDGLADAVDIDADNDGIPDIVEAGGIDIDGDGFVDYPVPGDATSMVDIDGDGLADLYDIEDSAGGTPGWVNGNAIPNLDTDGDGHNDGLDLDADNDGVPDNIEAGGHDPEGDGFVDTSLAPWDTDGDGLADVYDTDDNTVVGVDDGGEALIQTTADTNGDGIVNAPGEEMISGGGGSLPINLDGDSRANHLDIDADNDGILDVTETGATDSNNDGMVDFGIGAFIDTDNDGFEDNVDGDVGNDFVFESSNPLIITAVDDSGDSDSRLEYSGNGVADSDSEDVPDFVDVDSDNDGIYDNYEAQPTATYIPPTTADTDGDGLLDPYDMDQGAAQNGLIPYNHDSVTGDTTPDHLDLDSDADNIPDQQEVWDFLLDGDSKGDNVSFCNNVDTDGDGLVDCYDVDDNDATNFMWSGDPADDEAGASGTAAGTIFVDILDDILPDNIGNNVAEPDYRDNLDACATAQIYYGVTEASPSTTTNFEYDDANNLHVDGFGSNKTRATTYCEPDGDGWHYYFNPAEPENYLFAIKNSAGSSNTIPMWDLVDFIEIKKENSQASRTVIGSNNSTVVMTRDWHIELKNPPTNGSTFDVKFYFTQNEMASLDAVADSIETMALAGGGSYTRSFEWLRKFGGIQNANITQFGIVNEDDITANDLDNINESNPGNTDGTVVTTGNGKNYVQFSGLTDLSGGTAVIKQSFAILLPVTLSEFKAQINECDIDLLWTTESEKDFDYFEVEWSGDGINFSTKERVEANGGNFTQQYSYNNQAPAPFNYYRLKMVDTDGSFEYSKVIQVETECENNNTILVYPNPVSSNGDILNVEFFSNDDNIQFHIIDMIGRIVKNINLDVEANFINTVQINVVDLSAGTYFIRLPEENISKKFIIKE